MADSKTFDLTSAQLEDLAKFDRLSARGTIRLALKAAGLDPKTVRPAEMRVVVQKLLPAELSLRGVDGPEVVCQTISKRLGHLGSTDEQAVATPDSIFARFGGRS